MEDINIPIFAQAKIEYTKQLVEILYPHMYDGVKSVYDEAKIIYSTKTNVPIMLLFRELLEKVPIWNSEIIDSECSRIIQSSECDWIDDLITAVFISHTKILTSIGPNQSFQKINVTIPKTGTFIHKSYINVARELWKNPYLFNEQVASHEFQRNSKEIEDIIKACIETTIRNLLPIKEILREHLDSNETDTLLQQRDELKKMLREELQGLSKSGGDKGTEEQVEEEQVEEESVEEPVEEPVEEGKEPGEEEQVEEGEEGKEEPVEEEGKEPGEEEGKEPGEEGKEDGVIHELIQEIKDNVNDQNEFELTVEPKPTLLDEPTNDQVEKQCENIVVNDITLPVDVESGNSDMTPRSTMEEVKEPVYDNPTPIIDNESGKVSDETKERMQKMLVTEEKPKIKEVNVIKDHNIKTKTDDIVPDQPKPPQPSFSLSGMYKRSEQKPQELSPPLSEPKSPRKEIAEVTSDLDETSSLANFFNDVKQIVEDKGIKVNTQKNGQGNFTLFEDANEVDK